MPGSFMSTFFTQNVVHGPEPLSYPVHREFETFICYMIEPTTSNKEILDFYLHFKPLIKVAAYIRIFSV